MDGPIQSMATNDRVCNFCGMRSERFALHDKCMVEFGRRNDAGKCVLCGKRDMKDGLVWCAECYERGDTSYRDYPGGV